MHQLITDHVSRPGVTQQAKLWTALRDFITEFEEGAHRETFSKWDLYRSIIDILTDQLDLFEIAWECVEVITPLAGMGHYVRGIYLLHVLKKRLSSSSINRSVCCQDRRVESGRSVEEWLRVRRSLCRFSTCRMKLHRKYQC